MDSKQIYDKYCSRLKREGIVKALLCGMAIGLGVATALTLAFWIIDFEYFWIGAIIGVALIGATTPVFYRFVFRPTTKSISHRVDGLGLEERILTMNELKDDQSYIAQRQRADAQAALVSLSKAAGGAKLAMRIPTKIIAAVAAVAVAYVPIQTIGILSHTGTIPKAKEIVEQVIDKDDAYHTVSYIIYGAGDIDGEPEQVVLDGDSATTVTAVAEDGWYFIGWMDAEYVDQIQALMMFDMLDEVIESSDPVRTDENITDDFEICAVFVEMGDGDGEPGDGDGDSGEGESGDGDGENPGDPGEPREPQPGDGENQNENGDSSDVPPMPGDGEGAGSGDSKQDNTFLDGNTPLKDYYAEYYELAMQMLAEGKELPEDLRWIIESYFGGLHP